MYWATNSSRRTLTYLLAVVTYDKVKALHSMTFYIHSVHSFVVLIEANNNPTDKLCYVWVLSKKKISQLSMRDTGLCIAELLYGEEFSWVKNSSCGLYSSLELVHWISNQWAEAMNLNLLHIFRQFSVQDNNLWFQLNFQFINLQSVYTWAYFCST